MVQAFVVFDWIRKTMTEKYNFCLVLTAACLLALLSVFGEMAHAQTPEQEAVPTGTVERETATPELRPVNETAPDTAGFEGPGSLDGLIATRTPDPTATPGLVSEGVTEFTRDMGLAGQSFLGLAVEDWINLGISLLFILASYLIGTWLILRLLPPLARRTATKIDDTLLQDVGPDIRWLVVIPILQVATNRLIFISAELKAFLGILYFVVGLAIVIHIAWRLIDLSQEQAHEKSVQAGREKELAPAITLLTRASRVVLVIVGLTVLLSRLGLNVGVFVAALGLGGLALSLAARDAIADAITGFIILIDQPFRVGDRIEIQGISTWGDVADIGLRTTRIRTPDNRMVIVPNSIIGKNQLINYTYPDPRYRIQTYVSIAYGSDIKSVCRVIIDTVRQIEEVLPDKPVEALYDEMGESAMIFRVRWWVESYVDTRHVINRVHTTLQAAFAHAGIEIPYPTQTLNLQVEPETAGRLSLAFREPDQPVS